VFTVDARLTLMMFVSVGTVADQAHLQSADRYGLPLIVRTTNSHEQFKLCFKTWLFEHAYM